MRRVRVVVDLDELVARTRRSAVTDFADQNRAWRFVFNDRAGSGAVSYGGVHWIRQHNQERLVGLILLVVAKYRHQDRLELFACSEIQSA